jgi:ribosomal protein L16 Arg81 hydroxylase
MITQIEEIAASEFSARVFDKQYFQCAKPLVVRGLFLEDGRYDRWTLDLLLEAVKGTDRKIPLSVYERNEDEHIQFFQSSSTEEHNLPEAFRLGFSDPELTGRCYNLLEAAIPELVSLVEIPAFLRDKTDASDGNLWIGNGNITGLHFDAPNNYYFQIKGEKVFDILEPSHYFYLYPKGSNGSSIADVQNIDRERYPLTSLLKPIRVRLQPGDFLYLPSFWWHQVQSYGTYISLNYWGYPRIEQCLCYPGFYEIIRHFELGRLIEMFGRSNKYGIEDFSIREVIQMLLVRGYNWAAFIMGMALFQDFLTERITEAGISGSEEIVKRTEALYARMNKQELDFDNISLEHLGEDRFFDSCRLLRNEQAITDTVFKKLYRYASYLRAAKALDNVAVTPEMVNDLMDLYTEIASGVEAMSL